MALGFILAFLNYSPKQSTEESDVLPHELGLLTAYRIGHDWVDIPPEKTPDASQASAIMRGFAPGKAVSCTQRDCRTCEWMRLFGGEW